MAVVAQRSGVLPALYGDFASDCRTIVSRGESSRDGKRWEPDLALAYSRAG